MRLEDLRGWQLDTYDGRFRAELYRKDDSDRSVQLTDDGFLDVAIDRDAPNAFFPIAAIVALLQANGWTVTPPRKADDGT